MSLFSNVVITLSDVFGLILFAFLLLFVVVYYVFNFFRSLVTIVYELVRDSLKNGSS